MKDIKEKNKDKNKDESREENNKKKLQFYKKVTV